jgi:hypothetical protein
MSAPFSQVMGMRQTSFGWALYVKFRTEDYRPLAWSDVWAAFAALYPGRWAVQFFPPAEELVDEANIYHLYVLEDAPVGVSIHRRDPGSASACGAGGAGNGNGRRRRAEA